MSILFDYKGYEFEDMVGVHLQSLESKFPSVVRITSQPNCTESLRPYRADFELEYQFGGLTHKHLIECQNRKKSSHDIADKIYAIRGGSSRNRFIFIYKDEDYLSEPIARRLKGMGVVCYNFEAFRTSFVSQLEADIACLLIGRRAIEGSRKEENDSKIAKGKIEEIMTYINRDKATFVSARKSNNQPKVTDASVAMTNPDIGKIQILNKNSILSRNLKQK